jgi:hypothetical protein
MSGNRPPLGDVPMFAPCPACGRILRARVDLRAPTVRGTLSCPWCRRRVTVSPPAGG